MIKKRTVKRTVRRVSHAKKGNWSVLGVHGGAEGKQWQRGKKLVAWAEANVKVAKHGIKARAMGGVSKLKQLSNGDRQSLLNQIDRL